MGTPPNVVSDEPNQEEDPSYDQGPTDVGYILWAAMDRAAFAALSHTAEPCGVRVPRTSPDVSASGNGIVDHQHDDTVPSRNLGHIGMRREEPVCPGTVTLPI